MLPLIFFSLYIEHVAECCKAQWCCVDQRIALCKGTYILLLLSCAATMGDLFGDADDISSDEEKKGGEEAEKREESEVGTAIAISLFLFVRVKE